MATFTEAQRALGELFIIGFSGLELAEETSAFISQAGIGGVILFSLNADTPAQIAELTNEIKACRNDTPMLISVDHEGGRVQRFKKGFTKIPEAAAIAAMNSPKLAFEISEIVAKELKAVGINLNFCPVADIATNPKNPVIGNRSYGITEEAVSKYVTAVIRGHLVHGVQVCVKHFPGHGDTSVDSHLALPSVDTPLEVLREREFKPFQKAFKARCGMVMTAHILNTKIDSQFPATLSKIFLQDILRKELRYEKLIVSDDLDMKAIADNYGAEEAPRLALEAGCDMLIYRTEATARHGYESLIKALENQTLSAETVLRSVERVMAFKREHLAMCPPVSIPSVSAQLATTEHLAIIERVAERSKRG
ncbi:MAG: beta-N-acetylhexosaminidase [Bdellovibrionia bacterium]